MKLCFIADPASVHTQRWVGWFARGHDVTVICTTEDDALSDLPTWSLPARGAVPGARLARSVHTVRSVIRSVRPDVLHAHYINEPGWLGAAARFRPFVLSAWGSDVYRAPAESRLARRMNPWAVRAADVVTCDSADQARILRSWGAREVDVIGWGVDLTEFHAGVDGLVVRAELGIPADAPTILSPRQWLPNSNIPSVVEAHARVRPDAYLILKRLPRCETDHAAEVEAAIAASPARDRIRVVAEIPADRLPALYAAADVVVSLCATDGTPVSVLEAMAVGRPVVALRNASVAEWVSEPGGRLVESLNSPKLAAVLDELMAPAASEAAAAHNPRVAAARADRNAEMSRMADRYERLASQR